MPARPAARPAYPSPGGSRAYPLLGWVAGCFLALAILKLGTPVILPQAYEVPRNLAAFLQMNWPVAWGYGALFVLLAAAWPVVDWRTTAPRWLVWLPLAWLLWQGVATWQSIARPASLRVLLHFSAFVACYYVGLFALSRVRSLLGFRVVVLAACLGVVAVAFQQRYGELEATRKFIEEHEATGWTQLPAQDVQDMVRGGMLLPAERGYTVHPEVLKRARGGRVYGTLVYPNALAGLFLLLLPGLLVTVWEAGQGLPPLGRKVALGLMLYAGVAALVWSGSKAGWLLGLGLVLVVLLRLPFARSLKLALVGLMLVGGLGAFFLKYSGYFQKGATSVGARFNYWQAAVTLVRERPLVGHGPGTYAKGYQRLKPPEAEMAQLAHNDYLQQACDSGIPGFLLFLAWMGGFVVWVYRKSQILSNPFWLATSLGVLGWLGQACVEFGLYIPALAWTLALLLGWLIGSAEQESASTAKV